MTNPPLGSSPSHQDSPQASPNMHAQPQDTTRMHAQNEAENPNPEQVSAGEHESARAQTLDGTYSEPAQHAGQHETAQDTTRIHAHPESAPVTSVEPIEEAKPVPEDRYTLTVEAVADLFDQYKVSRDVSTIRRYCMDGKLKAVKIPNEHGTWFVTEVSALQMANQLKNAMWVAREAERQSKGATEAIPTEPSHTTHTEAPREKVESGERPTPNEGTTTEHSEAQSVTDHLIKIATLETKIEGLKERIAEKDQERDRQQAIYESQLDRAHKTLENTIREKAQIETLLASAGVNIDELNVHNNHPDQSRLSGIKYRDVTEAEVD